MHVNLNVDVNKMLQNQKQKLKTGMSMQSTVNNALKLPQSNPNSNIAMTQKQDGWGVSAQ